MPGTYSQLLLHAVFSTKHRQPWVRSDIAERLYPYMGGIVRAEKGVLYEIGGVEDHVHLCFRWRPDQSCSAPTMSSSTNATSSINAAGGMLLSVFLRSMSKT